MKKLLIILLFFAGCVQPTTTTLDGSTSYDPDGQIVWQFWEQVSGPKAIIKEPMKLKTEVILPEKGVYEFRLTVIDNDGAVTKRIIQKVK